MFNLLKLEYRNKNVETFDALMDVFNGHEDIEALHVKPDEFFDFRATLNQYSRSLQNGQTQKAHVFTISKERGATTLIKQDVKDGPETMDDLLPRTANRIVKFMTPEELEPKIKALLSELSVISPPGISMIKQRNSTCSSSRLHPTNEEL